MNYHNNAIMMSSKMSGEKNGNLPSKLSLTSKRKKGNTVSSCKSEKGKPPTHQTTNSCPRNCSCRQSHKPKYNFSDDGSENESITDYETATSTAEQSLQWKGKRLRLKEFKIELVRLPGDEHEKPPEPSINTSFVSCVSSLSCQPREYLTRHRIKADKSSFHTCSVTDPVSELIGDENMFIDAQDLDENGDPVSSASFIKETDKYDKPEESLSIQDNILKAVQNQSGRKIMSEEDEAFFWDWILKKD